MVYALIPKFFFCVKAGYFILFMMPVTWIIREIKSDVYGKPLTSDSSWEFLKIENKQIKTVQNNSYG